MTRGMMAVDRLEKFNNYDAARASSASMHGRHLAACRCMMTAETYQSAIGMAFSALFWLLRKPRQAKNTENVLLFSQNFVTLPR